MVRAPCCEKMGLKRGPWTPEEDKVLIAFITNYGHGNWRALPKQAGLLRCGKSCRLRWTNYLRPDIKRGNFSNEEEEAIIKLHEMLGNRWSAIAARLPGRTDNEIKNVWHTHLKKRLKKNDTTPEPTKTESSEASKCETNDSSEAEPVMENSRCDPVSPQPSTSEFSDSSTSTATVDNHATSTNDDYNVSSSCIKDDYDVPSDDFFDIDENFWRDPIVAENLSMLADFSPSNESDLQQLTDFSPYSSNLNEGMDFWFDLFLNAGDQPV